MKNSKLVICHETIYPGEQLSLALPLPVLFSCAPLYIPIKVIHGQEKGPVLLVTAAMYGNELNGTEIINRLVHTISPKRMKGTLIAIPVLNVYGLINRSRHLPGDVDLDTCFPGSPDGTHSSRVANIFATEIFHLADYCIDLQSGYINSSKLPQVYADFHDKRAIELAEVFNTPIILNLPKKEKSLRALAKEYNKPFLLYEAGEAMHFDEHAIKNGLQGILQVMKQLQMINEKSPKKIKQHKSFFVNQTLWIRASTSGISHTKFKLGQYVKKNETVCVVKDPFDANDGVDIRAPDEGIIIGKNNFPLVREGEGLFQLGIFTDMHEAADHFEVWEKNTVSTIL